MNRFDIIVIGGGHAGIEAALAAARLNKKTALLTLSIENIGKMPCNPSVGGPAKGIVVREISEEDLRQTEPVVEIAFSDLDKARKVLEDAGIKITKEVMERTSLEDFYFRLIGGGNLGFI